MPDEMTIMPGSSEPEENTDVSFIPGDDPVDDNASEPAEEGGDFKEAEAGEETPKAEEAEGRKERYEEEDHDKELFEL